jgi:hypothetical protein
MNRQLLNYGLLLAVWLAVVHGQTLTISPSGSTINANVQYVFQIALGATGITPGTATLTFDATAFSFTNSTAITGCANAITPTTLYSCSAASSNTITFRWTASMP